jgi:hypothetical protein
MAWTIHFGKLYCYCSWNFIQVDVAPNELTHDQILLPSDQLFVLKSLRRLLKRLRIIARLSPEMKAKCRGWPLNICGLAGIA